MPSISTPLAHERIITTNTEIEATGPQIGPARRQEITLDTLPVPTNQASPQTAQSREREHVLAPVEFQSDAQQLPQAVDLDRREPQPEPSQEHDLGPQRAWPGRQAPERVEDPGWEPDHLQRDQGPGWEI